MPRQRTIAIALLIAAACGGASESDGAGVTLSDSAGVPLVTIHGELATLPMLRVTDTLTLHGAPEDFYANNPSSVISLPDGRTILSDARNSALFASDGGFVGPFVRRGQGPGELQSLSTAWLTTGDSLWVSDFATRRLSLFGPSLDYVRSTPQPTGEALGSVSLIGELGRDTIAVQSAQVSNAPPMTEGRRESWAALGLWLPSSDSIVRGGERLFSIYEVAPIPGGDGILFFPPPATAEGRLRTLGRCTLYGYANRWLLEIAAPGGTPAFEPVGFVRAAAGGAESVTSELRAELLEGYVARYANTRFAAQFERLYRELPIPDSTPHFTNFLTTRDGAIWVQRYRGPTLDREDAWTVVDAGNARAWRFTLPPRTRLLGVDRGRALIAVRDEDDLETQHWLRLPELDDVALPAACQRNDAPN